MKSKIIFIIVIIFITVSLSSCKKRDEKTLGENSLPNIIIIYLDDMGYGDLTITGSTNYKTPSLDNLANSGMFFTHFYSPQAVSSASRAGLLTGCYPNRIGIAGALSHKSTVGISDDEETIADVLKKKGYATAIFGKWHLGYQEQFLPTNYGFDEFYGIPYSHDMWPYHPTGTYPNLPLYENKTVVNPNLQPDDVAHFTADFVQRTTDFIKRNHDKPFFVYWANPLPHVPLYVSEQFKGKSEQGLYGDVMMEIDWGVGQIIKTLEEAKLKDNTLVIFTSDNGPWLNYGNHAGSSGGFREGKGTTFEGGQRVPCLMMWKGVIPEGVVCNNLTSAIDILPTLAAISESPLPENKIDGVSILSLLKGDFKANPRETFYYYYQQNSLEAIRHGGWKLIFPHLGRTYEGYHPGNDGKPGQVDGSFQFEGALYDLRRDPGERYDMSKLHPEIVKALQEIAKEAREDLGDDLTCNPGKNRRQPGRVL